MGNEPIYDCISRIGMDYHGGRNDCRRDDPNIRKHATAH